MSSYSYWNKKRKNIQDSLNILPNKEYAQELINLYDRHLEIIEEILNDLAPEADDEQYTETTSWRYEDELKAIHEKTQQLEPIVEEKIAEEEHQELLDSLGMNEEQYINYLKEQRKITTSTRKK